MERCIGWLSAHWAGVLGAGLLVLVLGLASFRVSAVGVDHALAPPQKQNTSSQTPATTKTKREALRYGGKSFDQWRVQLETELKPAIRVDGLTAMGAFGANGYGAEATRVIVDLMAGYEPNDDEHYQKSKNDVQVVQAAFEAIWKIADPAFPVLWESLRCKNDRRRRFAIACFQRSQTDWLPPVSDLLKAAKEADPETREIALELLQIVEDKPRSCIPLLIECLKDEEHKGIRMRAMRNLNMIGPDAKDALPQLRRLRDRPQVEPAYSARSADYRTELDLIRETIKIIEGK